MARRVLSGVRTALRRRPLEDSMMKNSVRFQSPFPVCLAALGIAFLPVACEDDGEPSPGNESAGAPARAGRPSTVGGSGSGEGGASGGAPRGPAGATSGGASGGGSGGASGSGAGGAGEGGLAGLGGGAGGGGAFVNGGEGGIAGGARGTCVNVTFTEAEKTLLHAFSPLPSVPPDPSNAKADNSAAAALGQMLFFEKGYSGPLARDSDLGELNETGKISCASCHASSYLADDREFGESPEVSIGADVLPRNAPTLINSSFYQWTNWGGRFSAQWLLPPAVAENPKNMNSSRLAVAHLIADKYEAEYEAVFGPLPDITALPATGKPGVAAWDDLGADAKSAVTGIFANYGKAVEAYLRKLVSRESPFDRFVAGESAALDAEEQCGLKLFIGKARCNTCHTGAHFSDDNFHNLGVGGTDLGRYTDAPALASAPLNLQSVYSDDPGWGATREAGITNPMPDASKAAFRTPGLRGVALTAPYMHAGQLGTLEEVIEFYDRGGDEVTADTTRSPLITPLGLTDEEKQALVAFLGALTGEAVPSALLEDTSK